MVKRSVESFLYKFALALTMVALLFFGAWNLFFGIKASMTHLAHNQGVSVKMLWFAIICAFILFSLASLPLVLILRDFNKCLVVTLVVITFCASAFLIASAIMTPI